MNWRRASTQDG